MYQDNLRYQLEHLIKCEMSGFFGRMRKILNCDLQQIISFTLDFIIC